MGTVPYLLGAGSGVWLAPSSLMQGVCRHISCLRQSSADRRAPPVARTMPSFHHYVTLCVALITIGVHAKISGGPRGRFDASYRHHHVSARHAHYSYHPPNQINFMCRHCANPAVYPVYHGPPPSYVYVYRESGTRYGDLLTGLALYNLGRCCGPHGNSNVYNPIKEEHCSLQIIDREHFEETKFPCFMMSSFMERPNNTKAIEVLSQTKMKNETSDETGADSFNILSSHVNVKPFLSSNESVFEVRRNQDCVIWHNLTLNTERHVVPCSLLEQYAETMKPSGVPVYIWMPILLATIVTIYIFCYCCCRKKVKKEDAPLTQTVVAGYSSNYNNARN